MFKNYVMIAVRNLLRRTGYSLINIVGLAVGMSCCMLIGLFVFDEVQLDRFHTQSDRIYRLVREMRLDNGAIDIRPNTSGPAGPALKQDYPEVESSVRYISWGGVWTKVGDREFGLQFCLTDPDFFKVFDFELVTGNRETVLSTPLSVVVTESTAKRLFGDADPMGKAISVDDRYMGGEYLVAGVAKDPPDLSTLQFDLLCATASTT
jgi:putative ABC transport system permease protein